MKKIGILALCLLLTLSLTACGSTKSAAAPSASSASATNNESSPSETSETPAATESTQPSEETGDAANGELGDFTVSILSCETAEDIDGNPAIIVTYEWTNNSDETTSFMASLYSQAFQNGVECEPASVVADGFNAETYIQDIQPGATAEMQEAFTLIDTESPIDINVTELRTFEDNPPMVSDTFTFES